MGDGLPRGRGQREIPQDFSPEAIERATDAALKRLKTDRIDLLQLHNIRMEQVYDDALWKTLEKLKASGKIRYYGIALGPAIGWLFEGVNCIREREVTSIQHIYNMLEQHPGRAMQDVATELGKGCVESAASIGAVVTMSLGIATLQETGEFLFVEQPVEIEPAVEAAVGRLEETGVGRGSERGLPAVEAARFGEPLAELPAPHRVQEHHLGPALARRRLLPGREGAIDEVTLCCCGSSESLSLSLSPFSLPLLFLSVSKLFNRSK